MHKPQELSVAELESWLRDNPNADSIARHDMIARLRELKEKLKTINTDKNDTNN